MLKIALIFVLLLRQGIMALYKFRIIIIIITHM